MKSIAMALAMLLMTSVLQAEPSKHWYKDPKVWLIAGIQAGTAAWQIKASHDCRSRAGIGACFGGYGERKAMVGFVAGVNAGAFAMSMWWRHEDLPEWSLPAISAISFNVIDAARNQHASCKTECEAAKASGMRYTIK